MMKLEEILSVLENEDKRNDLIYKLKHAGENSQEVHAFHDVITSFHLNQTPKGFDQTELLQTAFRYSDLKETFTQYRLVCKSWKHAIETLRCDRQMDLHTLCEFAQNGQIPISYGKYIKMHKKIYLPISKFCCLNHWEIIRPYILAHVNKVNVIKIGSDADISNLNKFNSFFLQLLRNSQTTLNDFYTDIRISDLNMPQISLPNVAKFSLTLSDEDDSEIANFEKIMKTVLENCEYLQTFTILDIERCPNILEYLTTNYPKHFVASHSGLLSKQIFTKISVCGGLLDLEEFVHPLALEYLHLGILDATKPHENAWENYKTIFSLFPNLKGIQLSAKVEERKFVNFQNIFDDFSPENQNIWTERIEYLNTKGIKLMNETEYHLKIKELCKENKWGFQFWSK